MIKCDICGGEIEKLFLNKFRGTYQGSGKNKRLVCSNCQKKLWEV